MSILNIFIMMIKLKNFMSINLSILYFKLNMSDTRNDVSLFFDNDLHDRFILICKPEQSGKTFLMLHKMSKEFNNDLQKNERTINITFCDNSLLLTKQTSARVGNALKKNIISYKGESFKIDDDIYCEFSSAKNAKCNDKNSTFAYIAWKPTHNNIICCCNTKRMCDIFTGDENSLIYLINNRVADNISKINIWLDEADKYLKYISEYIIPTMKKFNNVNLYCLTATPEKLFKKYKKINVFPLKDTFDEHYVGWLDNKINILNLNVSTPEFVSHVLNKCGIDLKPGQKFLIPANVNKKSHEKVSDICLQKNMLTIVINGDGIKTTNPITRIVKTFKKDNELNIILSRLINELELNKYPVAIIGNICIGRGISIISENFRLTHAILNTVNNKSETSQLAGRLKGNHKRFEDYKHPVVYTTEKFDKIAVDYEERSKNLAKIAYNNLQNGDNCMITNEQFKTSGLNHEFVIHPEYFDTYTQACEFLNDDKIRKKMNITSQKRINKKSTIHKVNGYSVTSKLLKKGQKVEDLNSDHILTRETVEEIKAGRCISTTNKGSRYLILPVYENLNSKPEDVKFQVRYLSYKD